MRLEEESKYDWVYSSEHTGKSGYVGGSCPTRMCLWTLIWVYVRAQAVFGDISGLFAVLAEGGEHLVGGDAVGFYGVDEAVGRLGKKWR